MLMLWNTNCKTNIIQTIQYHDNNKNFHHLKRKKNQMDGGLFSRSTNKEEDNMYYCDACDRL
jgi:hypothetical protein